MLSSCSWGTFSGRTVKSTGRYTESSTVVRTLVSPKIIQTQSPSCPTSGRYSTESAECYPGTIKLVGLSPKKISSFLRPVKDNLGLRTPGVYRILCECGKVHIGPHFIIPPFSPLRPNTWIALKLSSTPTIRTERWVFVSESHGSLSSAPSRQLTPDLQGYASPCTVGSLVPRLLGQCSLGAVLCFPVRQDPNPALACYLLAPSRHFLSP
jgi:hypothetical protein